MTDALLASSSVRLTDALPGWLGRREKRPHCTVGIVHGEGIGPEVVGAACTVLEAVAAATGFRLELRRGDAAEPPSRLRAGLSASLAAFCESVYADGGAILCGPVGGRFVYELRARLDLFCKLVPLRPSPALVDATILRPERLQDVDLLIVRENVSGVYFGESGSRDGGREAYQHFSYTADQVARIVAVSARLARQRRGRLTVIVKQGGVPTVSTLWREQAEAAAVDHGVAVEVLDVDNASFQLVAQPQRFDVVVAPNLLGDVLADGATVLLGSRGMSYSANFGPDVRAVYQTGHGAAHDLAGSDRANPVAQILSVAMMLRESFGLDAAALRIEMAVEHTLAAGFRTADIAAPGARVVGTHELAALVAETAARPLATRAARA